MSRLSELASDRQYWWNINPDLTIGDGVFRSSVDRDVNPSEAPRLSTLIATEGYCHRDQLLHPRWAKRLSDAIESLQHYGWPPVFLFVYDTAWDAFTRTQALLEAVLGPEYRQLPDFWAWHLAPRDDVRGWSPHRDKGAHALREDGWAKSLTVWISLTKATPLGGCIYLLPMDRDASFRGEEMAIEEMMQNVRALPTSAGDLLCWNQAVLHWGARSSSRADGPRVSIACEFQAGDVEPFNHPLLDPMVAPPFEQRLQLIAKQVLQYQHMYPLSDEFRAFAEGLRP